MDFKLKILIEEYRDNYPALIGNEILLNALKKLDPTTSITTHLSRGGGGSPTTIVGITVDQRMKEVQNSIDLQRAKIQYILDQIDYNGWNEEFEKAKTKMIENYGE